MSFQDPDQAPLRLRVGKIVAAHGVKGLVKILPETDDMDLLEGSLYKNAHGPETLAVTLKNALGRYVLAELEGVTDRTAAEKLRLTELYIDKTTLPVIKKPGTYYHTDLIGLKALDETGAEIGSIIGVDNFGAGDLLDIRPVNGGASFYIPFTKDNVPDIAIEKSFVTLRNAADFMDIA